MTKAQIIAMALNPRTTNLGSVGVALVKAARNG